MRNSSGRRRSLIIAKNSHGPKRVPCGTPAGTSNQSENTPLSLTLCCLFSLRNQWYSERVLLLFGLAHRYIGYLRIRRFCLYASHESVLEFSAVNAYRSNMFCSLFDRAIAKKRLLFNGYVRMCFICLLYTQKKGSEKQFDMGVSPCVYFPGRPNRRLRYPLWVISFLFWRKVSKKRFWNLVWLT